MNSLEGGMFVKMVVCEKLGEEDHPFIKCCGATVVDIYNECLIGDDKREKPVQLEMPSASEFDGNDLEWIEKEDKKRKEWESYHFPYLHQDDTSLFIKLSKQMSRPYLAAIVLGTTGWSGWSDEKQSYWECSFDDLSDEGKDLYRKFESLYPQSEIHLLTFLDT